MDKLTLEPKCKRPVHTVEFGSQGVIKSLAWPDEVLRARRRYFEEMVSNVSSEFNPGRNIFEVEADNDKHERPDTEEYRLTVWKTEEFRVVFEE